MDTYEAPWWYRGSWVWAALCYTGPCLGLSLQFWILWPNPVTVLDGKSESGLGRAASTLAAPSFLSRHAYALPVPCRTNRSIVTKCFKFCGWHWLLLCTIRVNSCSVSGQSGVNHWSLRGTPSRKRGALAGALHSGVHVACCSAIRGTLGDVGRHHLVRLQDTH